jgi:LmbE family N-acetylglucosaminyl deacetylase
MRRLLNKLEQIYYYRHFSRVEEGPYRFLMRKIAKGTDIDFIERVWQMDHFREVLEPVPLGYDQWKNVLVLAPHQDDEAIGCGGLLNLLAKQGCHLTIGFLTDGAEASDPESSVPTRREEAARASSLLGAQMEELGIDNIELEIDSNKLTKLVEWLDQGWDAVFTIWPLDQPPKHRLCAYLLGKALERSRYVGELHLYAVHTDLLPNTYVDITSVIDDKQEMIRAYASQLRAQRYDHLSLGMDAWRSRFLPVSSRARYIETFMTVPASAYMDLLTCYERVEVHRLFKGHRHCMDQFKKLKDL